MAPSRKDLEKKLAKQLTGAVFNGRFTVDGQAGDKLPNPEKYTILKATKLPDDFWLLESRIEYGGKDVTVPITLRIVWADDTPMITLTDLTIPKMGTFSSRILIHGDRYAGSWQHDKGRRPHVGEDRIGEGVRWERIAWPPHPPCGHLLPHSGVVSCFSVPNVGEKGWVGAFSKVEGSSVSQIQPVFLDLAVQARQAQPQALGRFSLVGALTKHASMCSRS